MPAMKKFRYNAVNLQKEHFTGIFLAEDENDLASQLAKQGLFLVSSKPYSGDTPSAFFTLGTGKVKLSELTSFCRQFSIMISSGISLLDSLDILRMQPYSSYFRSILSIVSEDVRSGMMFSDAIEKHRKVFPDFFRSMMRVGEAAGKMDLVLESLADYYERDNAIRKKTKAAFAYPVMLMFMTVGIIALLIAFVIPKFRDSLSTLEITPTGITKAVYDFSDFILGYWEYLTLGVILIGFMIFIYSRTKFGKYSIDWMKIRMPLFGGINRDLIAARFARGFGLLLSSGMDIIEALGSVIIVFGNRDMEKRFRKATEAVYRGTNMSAAFEQYSLFPPILMQMISIGEKTNTLPDVLQRSCNFFDGQAEASINSVVNKIQPVMLGIMGAAVAIVFIAVYSPMLEIMTNLGV